MTDFKRSRSALKGLALVVFCIATFAGVFGLVTMAPTVIVDKMLERDIKTQAHLWETRVITRLAAGKSVFENRWLTEIDKEFLKNITLSSDIYRFALFTREGRVFWSSNEDEIGRTISASFFADIIATGEDYYTHMAVRPSEVDDFDLHAVAREEGGLREVAEIFTPVVRNGEVLGAIEFFTDITDIRNTFILRVRIGLGVICATVLGLVTAIVLVIRRANRVAVRRLNAQTVTERELLEAQLQMAREVRLLGELNEWLQSSRSLDELFDMVGRFMTHILPVCEGSVYVYSNSRDVLDGWASWNGG
ncbi:MAG: GGDEF domain-containing protein, partial [Silicimonas sp.]|nr:GGDEF domain-containing protein [Silicimonas sp.]